MRIMKEQIEIIEIISYIVNRNNFYKFIYIFLYFFALFKPNISIRFKLINASKLLLTNLLFPFKLSAWAIFLSKYSKSSGPKIYFLIIFCFKV